jgi:hypothetical protein
VALFKFLSVTSEAQASLGCQLQLSLQIPFDLGGRRHAADVEELLVGFTA